jgi:hypothetical protein
MTFLFLLPLIITAPISGLSGPLGQTHALISLAVRREENDAAGFQSPAQMKDGVAAHSFAALKAQDRPLIDAGLQRQLSSWLQSRSARAARHWVEVTSRICPSFPGEIQLFNKIIYNTLY